MRAHAHYFDFSAESAEGADWVAERSHFELASDFQRRSDSGKLHRKLPAKGLAVRGESSNVCDTRRRSGVA
jgi:hypothetical protein